MQIALNLMFILAMLSVGLLGGLMLSLVAILQKQWDMLQKEDYVFYFKGFLLKAKGNPVISVLTFSSFLLPLLLGLFHLINNAYQSALMFIAASIIFFIFFFLVTLLLNFPIYNEVLNWKDHSDAVAWETVRKRFFILNQIRMYGSIFSFVILVISGLNL